MKRAFSIGPILLLVSLINNSAFGQIGYLLQPISGADGVFETLYLEGDTVYRSKADDEGYNFYMYFKTNELISHQTVYVEVTYLDLGDESFGIDYNSVDQDYRFAEREFNNYLMGTGEKRTAVFELPDADFRDAQNLETDLRLSTSPTMQMHIISATLYEEPTSLFKMYTEEFLAPYKGPVYRGDDLIASDSLIGKVMCGYQGWFRAPGDPTQQGWFHYNRGDFTDLTVEMWPDMTEYTPGEQYPVPGWTYENGSQATLFSSANKRTILRHFQWMEAYGIDGAAVQRFISRKHQWIPDESFRVPSYAREAANRTGRTYYIMYDMSECDTTILINALTTDWQAFVDSMKITEDERYLHQGGKPVVGIFGFYSDRFSAALGNEVLNIFQNEGKYNAFVAGSGQWWVNEEDSSGWLEVFKRMDAWIPWNVGNYDSDYASTGYWDQDKTFFSDAGVLFMPLVYPGFSWDNLMDQPPGTTYKSRLKGDFMWQQFLDARQLKAEAIYVAMFDEVDEGTAIFKVTNDIPVNHYFIDLEGLNSDFYLLLAGEGTRLIRNEIPIPPEMPDFSLLSQPPVPDLLDPVSEDSLANPPSISWSSVEHESGISGYELEVNGILSSHTNATTDLELEKGEYFMRVRAINGLGNRGGWSEMIRITVDNTLSNGYFSTLMSDGSLLKQNYPNPFDYLTIIPFSIEEADFVTLEVLNLDGRLLATLIAEYLKPGPYQADFTSIGLSEGLYLFRLTTGSAIKTRKMTVIR